uniref:F-box domain-containing protein n=1 Tax=Leersia perrieri TaxID=77586 RepID=A0A0D9XY26_9ORYZ
MPYTGGWLSRRQRWSRRNNDEGTPLPDDALAAVFARLVDARDVIRCAATCRRWGRVVSTHPPAALSHARPLPTSTASAYSSPTLALGFFHQDDAHTRKRKPLPAGGRNGRVVLELAREVHDADDTGLKLCVCNPMTGDVSMLPPLQYRPGLYACTLLTRDDLDTRSSSTPPPHTFFKVLVVYNRPGFTALRSYSSETRRWSAEVAARRGKKNKMSTTRMQGLRHAVVHRGVAYWTVGLTMFAVRFDTPEPVELAMPPRGLGVGDLSPNNRVLGATPDGKLVSLYMLECGDFTAAGAMVLQPPPAGQDDDDDMSKWEWRFF